MTTKNLIARKTHLSDGQALLQPLTNQELQMPQTQSNDGHIQQHHQSNDTPANQELQMLQDPEESKSPIEQQQEEEKQQQQQMMNCSNSNEQFNQNQREEEMNSAIEQQQPMALQPLPMILCLGMVFTKNFLGNDIGQSDRDRTRCLGKLFFKSL
jgi:hypothetical protein